MRSTTAIVTFLAAVAGLPAASAAPLPAQPAAALEATSSSSAVAIDNRHYTPHVAIPASVVLSTPRPITTTYLMGLASSTKVRVSTLVGGVLAQEAPVPVRIHSTTDGAETVLVASEMEASEGTANDVAEKMTKESASATSLQSSQPDNHIPESLRMESLPNHRLHDNNVPCIYVKMRRDYNDMMVISLVAVFLLVIVAVELWDSSERTTDIEVALAGTIKLGDEPVLEKQPLSVQASPVVIASPQTHA